MGCVVLRLGLKELGTQKITPVVARFKISSEGTSDWVPLILGARALDCPERGGLGFLPGPIAHAFTRLGILVERAEEDCPPLEGEVFALRASALDSDDEEEAVGWGAGSQRSGQRAGSVPEARATVPLIYDGIEPVVLSPGERGMDPSEHCARSDAWGGRGRCVPSAGRH